jgi:hypothetical protein
VIRLDAAPRKAASWRAAPTGPSTTDDSQAREHVMPAECDSWQRMAGLDRRQAVGVA